MPLPGSFRTLWGRLVAGEHAARSGTGSVADAIVTAHRLEAALARQHGSRHPHTVGSGWRCAPPRCGPGTVELLVGTAQRRREVKARPAADTGLLIRNAYAAWRKLAEEDPESAREAAGQVLALLVLLSIDPASPPGERDAKRARVVVRWIGSGAVA
ncbi:hypothetical protein [Streptomyces sp. I6]|uniref:hypothetical protein n=1 Tax=Streptomyces sp. I6 TaxID=2483113 RepID=UPI00288048C4|nr:hypothetical protein [Streptomyces sp. I6]